MERRKKHPDESWKSASHYVTERVPRPFTPEGRPSWSTWREERNTLMSPENQHHIMWLRGYPDLLHQRVDQAEVHGEREKNTLMSPENQHHIMWLRGYPDLLHQRVDQAEVHGEREKNTLMSPENQHHIMWLRGYPDLLHQRVDQAEVHGEKKETHTLTTSPGNQHHMYQRWKISLISPAPHHFIPPPSWTLSFLGEWEWDWLVGLINKVSYYNQYNF